MEDFVPYELAVKLEQKGFKQGYNIFGYRPIFSDETTIRFISNIGAYENKYFGDNIDAPTISQVLKWLREEKKIHFEFVAAAYGYNVIISQTPDAGGTDYYYTHMNDDGPNDGGAWDRCEDAALYCIEYVIDNNLI